MAAGLWHPAMRFAAGNAGEGCPTWPVVDINNMAKIRERGPTMPRTLQSIVTGTLSVHTS